MSMIGNQPGVSSQRTVLEEVVTGSPKSAFVPQAGYIKGYVDVLVNGIEIDATDFTAADGITVTLGTAAAVGDTVKIKAWLPRGLSDGYLKSEADAKFAPLVNGNMILAPNAGGNRVIGFASGSDTTLVLQGGGTSGSGANLELTRDYLAYLDANTTTFRSVDGATVYGVVNGNGAGFGTTPVPWVSGKKAVEVGYAAQGIASFAVNDTRVVSNVYYDGAYKYGANGFGAMYLCGSGNGAHSWYSAANNTNGAGSSVSQLSQQMLLDISGNLSPAGNLVLANGKGIDFSANGNAGGAASEVLNDYEAGTWTPVLNRGTTSPTISYLIQEGKYTKIGRQVTVHCTLQVNSISSNGAGINVVTGLPFVYNNNDARYGANGIVHYNNCLTTVTKSVMAYANGFVFNNALTTNTSEVSENYAGGYLSFTATYTTTE